MADKDVVVPGGYNQRFKIVATDDHGNPVLEPYTAIDGAGGGGGGAITVADGADVAQGTTTDIAWAAGAGTLVALQKAIATVALSTNPAQIYQSNPYLHIAAAGTFNVKASPGALISIVINKTGTTDVLTVYDNTAGSGTVMAIITGGLVGQVFRYDTTAGTGITIVVTGTAGDYTVTFR